MSVPPPDIGKWNLHLRARAKHAGLAEIKSVIENGADPHYDNDAIIETLLEGHSRSDSEKREILQYLFEMMGCKQKSSNRRALMQAVFYMKPQCARYLIEKGYDPNALFRENDGSPATPLTYCLYLPEPEDMIGLLIANGADVAAHDQLALKTAIMNGKPREAKILIKHGADLNADNGRFFTGILLELYESWKDDKIASLEYVEKLDFMLLNGAKPLRYGFNLPGLLGKLGDDRIIQATIRAFHLRFDERLSAPKDAPPALAGQSFTALRGRFKHSSENERGLVYAARSGTLPALLSSNAKDVMPMDLLYCDADGNRVIDYLGARGELHAVFTPDIWTGRIKEAKALYAVLCPHHQGQVDIEALQLHVSKRRTPPQRGLKRRR